AVAKKELFFNGIAMLGEAIDAINAVRITIPAQGEGDAPQEVGFFDGEEESQALFGQLVGIYENLKQLNEGRKLTSFLEELSKDGGEEVFGEKKDHTSWTDAVEQARSENRPPILGQDVGLRFGRIVANYIVRYGKDPEAATYQKWTGSGARNKNREQQLRDILKTPQKSQDLFDAIDYFYFNELGVQAEGEKTRLGALVARLHSLRSIDELALYLEKLPQDRAKALLKEHYEDWAKVLKDDKEEKANRQKEEAPQKEDKPKEQKEEAPQNEEKPAERTKATERELAFFAEKELSYDAILDAYLNDNETTKSESVYYRGIMQEKELAGGEEKLKAFVDTGDRQPLYQSTRFFNIRPPMLEEIQRILSAGSHFAFQDETKKNRKEVSDLNLSLYALDAFLKNNEPTNAARFLKASEDLLRDLKLAMEGGIFTNEPEAKKVYDQMFSLAARMLEVAKPEAIREALIAIGENRAGELIGTDEDLAKWIGAYTEKRLPKRGENGEELPEEEVVRTPPTRLPEGLSFKFGTLLSRHIAEKGNLKEYRDYVRWTGNEAGIDLTFDSKLKELFSSEEIILAAFLEKGEALLRDSENLKEARPKQQALLQVIRPLVEAGGVELYRFFKALPEELVQTFLSDRDRANAYREWTALANGDREPDAGQIADFFALRSFRFASVLEAYIERKGTPENKEFFREFAGFTEEKGGAGKLDTYLREGDEKSLSALYRRKGDEQGGASEILLSSVADRLREDSRILWQDPEKARSKEALQLELALRLLDTMLKGEASADLAKYRNAVGFLSAALMSARAKPGLLNGEEAAAGTVAGLSALLEILIRFEEEQSIADYTKTLAPEQRSLIVPEENRGRMLYFGPLVRLYLGEFGDEEKLAAMRSLGWDREDQAGGAQWRLLQLAQFELTGEEEPLYEEKTEEIDGRIQNKKALTEPLRLYLKRQSRIDLQNAEAADSVEMGELNLRVWRVDEIIRENHPTSLPVYKTAVQKLFLAFQQADAAELFSTEHGQEVKKELANYISALQDLGVDEALDELITNLPQNYAEKVFASGADYGLWLERRYERLEEQGGQAPEDGDVRQKVPKGIPENVEFRFGALLARFAAQKGSAAQYEAVAKQANNEEEKETYAKRIFVAFVTTKMSDLVQIQREFAYINGVLLPIEGESLAKEKSILALIGEIVGPEEDKSRNLARFFRGLHPLFKKELFLAEDGPAVWNAYPHPQNREAQGIQIEVDVLRDQPIQFSALFAEYVERKGTPEQKTFYRISTGLTSTGEEGADVDAFIERGEGEERLYRPRERNQSPVLLPGVQEVLRQRRGRFALSEETMRRPEMAELSLRAMIMDRHLKQNIPVGLARFSQDVTMFLAALSDCSSKGLFEESAEAADDAENLTSLLVRLQMLVNENELSSLLSGLSQERQQMVLGNAYPQWQQRLANLENREEGAGVP
ncbi:MAG: hypothetical protein IJ679_02240, partial [Lachnospiraceae bacterium]|nr:hypothetical protein [Lachnospiraceae bacterium]